MGFRQPEEERRLLRAIRRGEPRAFDSLVRLHQDNVYGLCLRMLGDRQEAEDLTQEVFLTVFKAIDGFRGDSSLSTWIYRITRNHCLNRIKFLKRRGHGRKQQLSDTKEAGADGTPLGNPLGQRPAAPDRSAEQRQLQRLVEEKIKELSPEHREVVVLRDMEMLSYEEIQQITGLAMGTIKSRLHRARLELCRLLAPILEDYVDG
ncbi:MAG: sigma-70 family RNA polymerase sigma factor [Deltaproteobacteria bacterium]|nr:MAG: sigma-70 family RNA polymerase sigma factor [Deltaproteobacteria bacterium]